MKIQIKNPDGTAKYITQELHSVQVTTPASFPGAPSHKYFDDLTAMQIGVQQIIHSITFKSVNRRELYLRDETHVGAFQIEKIYLDWPDAEDSFAEGSPTAVIMQDGWATYDYTGQNFGGYLEDTLDCFGEGTILRRLGYVTTDLLVDFLIPNKDDRSAVRKSLVEAFAAEPQGFEPGRKVVIPNYYNRLARYVLKKIQYTGDDPESAKSHLYGLLLQLEADIEVVSLVQAPPVFKPSYGVSIVGADSALT